MSHKVSSVASIWDQAFEAYQTYPAHSANSEDNTHWPLEHGSLSSSELDALRMTT